MLNYVNLLAAAGNETTTRLIGWTGKVLAEHPDQRQELVDDRSLVPNAIEELLRYEAPSPVQARYVTRDVEHHGQVVPEGSAILLLNGSANRDDRKFPNGDRFDIHRKIDHHLVVRVRPPLLPRRRARPGSRAGSRSTRCCSASPRGRSTGTTPSRPGPPPCAAGSASRCHALTAIGPAPGLAASAPLRPRSMWASADAPGYDSVTPELM